MQLTKAQKAMVKDGFPSSLFFTEQQRKKAWEDNPPRPMPSFDQAKKSQDQATIKLIAELEEQKKAKAKTRIHKMLSKKEDHTGQRWDGKRGRWIPEEQVMISITTNTRGVTKMKDYAEMSLAEMATAYNKISGKPPIAKFKDKATGLKRLAEAKSKLSVAKTNGQSTVSTTKKVVEKAGSENKRAAEFGARVGSFREKLIIALDEAYRKQVSVPDLLKAVYGSKNTENTGALTMVLKGAQTMIEKNKLPYTLKKEKNEGEISYGLVAK